MAQAYAAREGPSPDSEVAAAIPPTPAATCHDSPGPACPPIGPALASVAPTLPRLGTFGHR